MQKLMDSDWTAYLKRYRNGEWRSPIFRDMILSDAQKIGGEQGNLTFLDIGCGGGFDSDEKIQRSIARVAGQYIGIEPDTEIQLNNIFSLMYRCYFDDAPIKHDSIDIAFAVMVLEHFENPKQFWNKVHNILRPRWSVLGFYSRCSALVCFSFTTN